MVLNYFSQGLDENWQGCPDHSTQTLARLAKILITLTQETVPAVLATLGIHAKEFQLLLLAVDVLQRASSQLVLAQVVQ